MPIIEDILSKNNVTTGNENSIRWKLNDVISKYAEQNFNNDSMYFVKDSKKTYWSNNEKQYNNNFYTVLKVENNKIEEIEVSKKDMPKDIGVNDVYRIENGKYVIDDISSKELQEEIIKMAKEIIDSGYSIIDEAKKLEKKYYSLMKNNIKSLNER